MTHALFRSILLQLAHIQQDLHKVQDYFQAAPEMANLPKRLNELSASVATFGSQIRDLGATVDTLKATNVRIQDAQTAMQQNVSSIKVKIGIRSDNIFRNFEKKIIDESVHLLNLCLFLAIYVRIVECHSKASNFEYRRNAS